MVVKVINSTVTKIHKNPIEVTPRYKVFYKENGIEVAESKNYDIVIIAAPMTSDQISPIIFTGFENKDLNFSGEFQTTYATFVVGVVNASYFGLNEKLEGGGIMSCNPPETKISSIGQLSSVMGEKNTKKQVWKIFSREKLDNSTIYTMFPFVEDIQEIKWKAYPKYSSARQNGKFKLDTLMYYVNAIEWAASAMEMSAISGRNAAILAFTDYNSQCLSYTGQNDYNNEVPTHSSEL